MNFAKRKGDISPVARGDAKWRDARVVLNLEGDKWWVGRGRDVYEVDRLGSGSRSWNLCAFTLVLLFYPQIVRTEMEIMSKDARESLF